MNKKLLRHALSILIVAGIFVALWPLGQTAYSQWSQRSLQAQWAQSALSKNSKAATQKPTVESANKASQSPQQVAVEKDSFPATRIVIRDAGTDVVVLDGWDESTLRRAPGHLPASAFPGKPGNCVIAGHRNVYGSPFYNVDKLMAGAPIELQTPEGTFTYTVVNVFATTDSDQTVMQPPKEPNARPLLTLITCTIPRTSNRIIVTAELTQ